MGCQKRLTYCKVIELIFGEYWHELAVKMHQLKSAFYRQGVHFKAMNPYLL